MFPKAKLHVGAVAATDSRFFAYCFEAVVPRDLDIYIVELDINNGPYVLAFIPTSERGVTDVGAEFDGRSELETLRDDDSLMRGLLQLPQEPAVIRASAIAIIFEELARGAVSALITSEFFDVPVIG